MCVVGNMCTLDIYILINPALFLSGFDDFCHFSPAEMAETMAEILSPLFLPLVPGRKPTLPHTDLRPPQSIAAQRPDKQLNCKRRNPSSSVAQRDSRVNKHLRLDKIAIKGFSPEISTLYPSCPQLKIPINPSMENARFSRKSKMAASQHRQSRFVHNIRTR